MRNEILISSAVIPNAYFLGPMGDPDPSNFIHQDCELYDLNQCLTLSLSEMERNDSLLISASYFWSNALNAFVFGHGPMTITLADVYMLTGLRITRPVQPYEYLGAGSKRLAKIADCTGWASYILNHVEDESSVSE